MTMLFNLEYHTTFGEQLVLNLNGADGTVHSHNMSTNDGHTWTLDLKADDDGKRSFDYWYSVRRGATETRREWALRPHRMLAADASAKRIVTTDRWTDTPADAHLYTSAFTECVAKRTPTPHPTPSRPDSKRTLRLKVHAPQLRSHEVLGVVGAAAYLNSWDSRKALPMTERGNGLWTVELDSDRLPWQVELKFVALSRRGDQLPMWEDGDNRVVTQPEMRAGDVVSIELADAHFAIAPWRGAGTVVPVFSLRTEGSFGVGDFGDLRMMTDWCAQTGQRVLQVLPINDTTITHTWTDSYPYNSISIYALHPQYIDLRQLPPLKDEQAAREAEQLRRELNSLPQIDYERVNSAKTRYLQAIYRQEGARTARTKAYRQFVEHNRHWLEPYADYCVQRDGKGQGDTGFWYFVQYHLDAQMRSAHEHARSLGVVLKGDIPIGISRDGVEARVEPRYFNLDGQAGAPPDAFSANGQNWGFPTYDWDAMLADGCSWWVRRFRKMAEYFDAYRIDHVLGFFRIWEIPIDAVHGLLGQFSPALGMTREEIEAYGLPFDEDHMTRPFIADWTLQRMFGDNADHVKARFLQPLHDDLWQMRPDFDTQRKVERWYTAEKANPAPQPSAVSLETLRDSLYAMISDVLFVRDRKHRHLYHPRIGVQSDFVYEALWDKDKDAFNRLYNDYFYRRNNHYWYHEAMKKLPRLVQATRMLVCAEDLGMVPECVPWVMDELRILSLEIQSMPKDPTVRFGHLDRNPYRSVATISTHDMATLRQWWDEDAAQTQAYYAEQLHHDGPAPHPLTGAVAHEIVSAHLASPSMLCLLSLQDWLSMDESLRLPDADAERINIPANPRHYWRWRMHLTIEQLMQADGLNHTIGRLIADSGRN